MITDLGSDTRAYPSEFGMTQKISFVILDFDPIETGVESRKNPKVCEACDACDVWASTGKAFTRGMSYYLVGNCAWP